jgi:hypothetical protein
MLCLGDVPAVRPPSCFSKSGCRPPAGSNPSTKERVPGAVAIRSATGRRGASLPHVRRCEKSQSWMFAIVMAGGGPNGACRMPEILGREDAAGERTASAFFERGRMVAAEVEVWLAHHPPDRDREECARAGESDEGGSVARFGRALWVEAQARMGDDAGRRLGNRGILPVEREPAPVRDPCLRAEMGGPRSLSPTTPPLPRCRGGR